MFNFRFEDFEIWKMCINISNELFDIADRAENLKLYRFAEQLRAAGMSITNNISEGSGSFSNKEFASFLNIARRSIYECANILFIFEKRKIITEEEKVKLFGQLKRASSSIANFRKTLL
mgnify:CR=1 FL=1